MAKKFPNLAMGFDLVDNEDMNAHQYDLKEILVNNYRKLKEKYKSHGHYVFHGGESHDLTNHNLADIIILGT